MAGSGKRHTRLPTRRRLLSRAENLAFWVVKAVEFHQLTSRLCCVSYSDFRRCRRRDVSSFCPSRVGYLGNGLLQILNWHPRYRLLDPDQVCRSLRIQNQCLLEAKHFQASSFQTCNTKSEIKILGIELIIRLVRGVGFAVLPQCLRVFGHWHGRRCGGKTFKGGFFCLTSDCMSDFPMRGFEHVLGTWQRNVRQLQPLDWHWDLLEVSNFAQLMWCV